MRRLAVLLALVAASAAAQPVDTMATSSPTIGEKTPRGAVTRALIVPGLGQVYNGQYVKAPIAVAGVAGAVAYAVFRQRRYELYRRAAVYAGCLAVPGDPVERPDRVELCTNVAPDYADEYEQLGGPAFATISSVRDTARGQRDVGVLVVGVAYAFQVLDAYVAAELASFDVSEDVALEVQPGTRALSLRVRL